METLNFPAILLVRWLHFGLVLVPLFLIYKMHTEVLQYPSDALSAEQIATAKCIHFWMFLFLLLATISGAWSVAVSAFAPGIDSALYVRNPKLHAKVAVVAVLFANSYLIHRFLIGRLVLGYTVAAERTGTMIGFALMNGVSLASWLWACLLGLGRTEWSFNHSFNAFATWWLVTVLVFTVGGFAHLWRCASIHNDRFEPTELPQS